MKSSSATTVVCRPATPCLIYNINGLGYDLVQSHNLLTEWVVFAAYISWFSKRYNVHTSHHVFASISSVVQKKPCCRWYVLIGIFRLSSPESEQLRWPEQERWYEVVVFIASVTGVCAQESSACAYLCADRFLLLPSCFSFRPRNMFYVFRALRIHIFCCTHANNHQLPEGNKNRTVLVCACKCNMHIVPQRPISKAPILLITQPTTSFSLVYLLYIYSYTTIRSLPAVSCNSALQPCRIFLY